MIPFTLITAHDPSGAVDAFLEAPESSAYIAGGTTLLDLAKLHVEKPKHVIDVSRLENTQIVREDGLVKIGANAKMSQVADDEYLSTNYPVLTESLWLAASAQIRNMASMGGNILQRVRCSYFRDGHSPCNKREPGSGCAAVKGEHRGHAVLGGSDNCFAFHPSDLCVALRALDATVHTRLADGEKRAIAFSDFHLLPGDSPQLENALRPGELIESIQFPELDFAKASVYEKVRDRSSYQFALASAAVILSFEGDRVKSARIALGGVATVPWRASKAEAELTGKTITTNVLERVSDIALEGAQALEDNAYKIPLAKNTIVKAIARAASRA